MTRFTVSVATVLVGRLCLALSIFSMVSIVRADDSTVSFNRDIRPILSDRCFHCHGPDATKRQADLRLDTAEGARADLGGHAAIVPGDAKASHLWQRIVTSDADQRMPPAEEGEPLSAAERDLMKRWIEQGAAYEVHWSYAPLRKPDIPVIEDDTWPANPVDQFIRRSQLNQGLSPSPEANRVTLLRRVYFDLTGLPPEPQQVQAFLEDTRPNAYQRVVDELLASPRFGERLAVYWLDLVRYADTVGYHGDQDHNATLYREYVIRALNEGISFADFTREQLAGDLLPSAGDRQLAASGYNRLLQTTHEGGAQDKEYLAKYAADRVRNISTVWMGATLGCAECHNHKYDPYTQRDFYSMAAFFADLNEQGAYNAPNSVPTRRAPEKRLLADPERRLRDALLAEIRELESKGGEKKQDQIESLRKQVKSLEKHAVFQMVSESKEPRAMRVLDRGDWMDTSGEMVTPAGPEFLPPVAGQGRRTRLDLADWLVSRDQPQTSRVLVNRLWALLLGEGISRGVEDTGSQGEWPTHLDLLNYLSVDLLEHQWDLKHLIRQIVTSRTYRQSSASSESVQADPENIYWTRQSRFRLAAEMVRDQALAISGLLVERVGGPSAKPYQPEGYFSHLNFPQRKYKSDRGAGQYRRGVYMHWQRQFLHPMLQAFDAPSREECTAARPRSNTPQAALVLMNDPTFVEASRRLAARALMSPAGDEDEGALNEIWLRAVSRLPDDRERKLCVTLLTSARNRYSENAADAKELLGVGLSSAGVTGSKVATEELAAWTQVARAVLALSETVTRN